MTSTELKSILHHYNENYKNTWEQVRYIAYVTAAISSDKIKKPQDLIKFDWEKKTEVKLTPEELKKKEEEILKYFQNNDTK